MNPCVTCGREQGAIHDALSAMANVRVEGKCLHCLVLAFEARLLLIREDIPG